MVIVGGGDGSLSRWSIISWARTRSSRSCRWAPPTASPGRSACRSTSTAPSRSSPMGGAGGSTSACIDGDYFANAAALGLSAADRRHGAAWPEALSWHGRLSRSGRCAWRSSSGRSVAVTLDDGATVIAGRPRHGSPTAATMAASSWSKRQSLDSGEMVIQAVTGKSLLHLAWSWFSTLVQASGTATRPSPNGEASE